MSYRPDVVMITGATSSFGIAFAKRFAAIGCKLILTGRNAEKLHALASTLSIPHHVIVMDIRDRKAIETAFAALPKEFHNIDLLINNAGGALGLEPAQDALLDDWQDMIATNNLGLVVCTRLALPDMVARKRGHIINIGSVAGTYPYPGGHVYCAVKAFVKQFSLSIRADLISTGVRVTNIEPGMVETEFSVKRFKGDEERAAKVYAGANPLTADDVAETVFWAATLPPHVNVNSLEVMPTTQAPGPLIVHRGG
jgi:3-hydroxy acid dehydrogenase/malonic semialdehyde reductase